MSRVGGATAVLLVQEALASVPDTACAAGATGVGIGADNWVIDHGGNGAISGQGTCPPEKRDNGNIAQQAPGGTAGVADRAGCYAYLAQTDCDYAAFGHPPYNSCHLNVGTRELNADGTITGISPTGNGWSIVWKAQCADVDCAMTEWSGWSACDGGTQSRTQEVATSQSGNGAACPVADDRTEIQTCADCVMGEWGEWGACEADGDGAAEEKRTRSIVTPMVGEATACGETTETKACVLPAANSGVSAISASAVGLALILVATVAA